MAMNRKEAAALAEAVKAAEDARKAVGRDRALGWPCVPKPTPVDVRKELEGKPFGTLFVGWAGRTVGSYGAQWSVKQGCSNGYYHGDGRTDKTTSQGAGRFFRTRLDALLAARWESCEAAAKQLAEIDAEIAGETNGTGGCGE